MIFHLGPSLGICKTKRKPTVLRGPPKKDTRIYQRNAWLLLFSELKFSARRAMPLSNKQIEYFIYSKFSRDSNGTEPKIFMNTIWGGGGGHIEYLLLQTFIR